MTRSVLLTMVLLAAAASPPVALASERSDFYAGVGVGVGTVDTDVPGGPDFDGSALAWKGTLGYNLVLNPHLDLGLEVGYFNLGDPDDNNVEVEIDGWHAFGLVSFNIGRFGLFGKAGLAGWESEVDAGGPSADDDGTDPVYGVGASMRLGPWQLRAEAEKYDIDDVDDVYMISANVLYAY